MSSSDTSLFGKWLTLPSWAIPPVAASISTIPVFYGYVVKSAHQMQAPIPKMTPLQILKGGMNAGLIVGAQTVVQIKVEKKCKKYFGAQGVIPILASSIIVGSACSPILAVFNGKTMGYKISESLRKLSVKQVSAITIRETSFLGAMAISSYLNESMKGRTLEDNQGARAASSFASGVIGSFLGHIPDTLLTRWQKGLQVDNVSQLIKGAPARALTIGSFIAIYQFVKEKMEANFVKR